MREDKRRVEKGKRMREEGRSGDKRRRGVHKT